jgi:hypothetical protein
MMRPIGVSSSLNAKVCSDSNSSRSSERPQLLAAVAEHTLYCDVAMQAGTFASMAASSGAEGGLGFEVSK